MLNRLAMAVRKMKGFRFAGEEGGMRMARAGEEGGKRLGRAGEEGGRRLNMGIDYPDWARRGPGLKNCKLASNCRRL